MDREDKIIQKFIEKFPWEKLTDEQYNKSYAKDFITECINYIDNTENIYQIFETDYVDISIIKPQSVKDVIEILKKKYGFEKWQYYIINKNNIETIRCELEAPLPLLIVYPDYENNIKVMDTEFGILGYFNSKTYKHIDDNGHSWCVVTYNPKKKYEYSDTKQGNGVIYHITPVEVLSNIKKNGIVPVCNNSTYNGEPRSFFFKDYNAMKNKESMEMMISKAKIDWKRKEYSGMAAILTVLTGLIPDSINFYLDPNAEGCIFCNDVIKPQWIAFDETQILNLY